VIIERNNIKVIVKSGFVRCPRCKNNFRFRDDNHPFCKRCERQLNNTVKCKQCHGKLVKRHPAHVFCNRLCKIRFWNRNEQPAQQTRTCSQCKIDFVTKVSHQLYCSKRCANKSAVIRYRNKFLYRDNLDFLR